MLDEWEIETLRQALDGLAAPRRTGIWAAVEPLGRLGTTMDLVIDFHASSTLGVPVILAARRPRVKDLLAALSPRRRRVAELLLEGASNKEIARALGLSIGTVKDHVHDILTSPGCRTRAELISAALKQG